MASNLLSKIASMMSGGGASDGSQLDESKALQFTQDRWNDLKNSYVVIHQ